MDKVRKNIAIIGGGPSGLIAAETLAKAGNSVTIYDRMPSLGRKLQMAGRGGLNLTHSEPLDKFLQRYGAASTWLTPLIKKFSPDDLQKWCEDLGQEIFTGSSGRVFPKAMKAAPLLRAWLRRLDELGVKYMAQHEWLGFDGDALRFANGLTVKADATLLALGGASWPRLGSDGSWVKILQNAGVEISPLRPANCGFKASWSEYFGTRFAGTPLKPVTVSHKEKSQQGEVMITSQGIEGGAIYTLSSTIRESIENQGSALIHLDLRPGVEADALKYKLQGRGSQSMSSYLRKAGLSPVAINMLRESTEPDQLAQFSSASMASLIKAVPVTLTATSGLARAISTAGGITQKAVHKNFMLVKKPGVFVAGEMLDWEAPTGGYLLQACFSTGIAAAEGILKFIQKP